MPPQAPSEAPPCRSEGEICDGATSDCCSYSTLQCDLRPGAPTYRTCRSLTGWTGDTCKQQGQKCEADWQCCPFLKCAAGAADGSKQCTWTTEYGSLVINITMAEGDAFDRSVQEALLAGIRSWMVVEGTGATGGRVVDVQPWFEPVNASDWGHVYGYEMLIGAETRAALDNAVEKVLGALNALGPGGLCGVAVTSLGGTETICTLAAVSAGREEGRHG